MRDAPPPVPISADARTVSRRQRESALFSYTDEEWTSIEHAVQRGAWRALSQFERRRLLQAANEYRALSDNWLKDHRRELTKSWSTVGRLAQKLRAALATATALHRWQEPHIKNLPTALSRIEQDAVIYASPSYAEGIPERENYYSVVLSVWKDEVGGRLGISRHPETRQVRGPFVRYFLAVTGPVLGPEAPSVESIPAIVKREKARRIACSG